MDWNKHIKIDPETNRRRMMPIVVVVVALILAVCLGVYFGLFAGRIMFGGA